MVLMVNLQLVTKISYKKLAVSGWLQLVRRVCVLAFPRGV